MVAGACDGGRRIGEAYEEVSGGFVGVVVVWCWDGDVVWESGMTITHCGEALELTGRGGPHWVVRLTAGCRGTNVLFSLL